ncbi:hypothetical protein [Streptomyces sp. 2323.1]|uniref:hypothetical protein n=1 Tax=Streptomyces sp. 2323.1 TaxID=1938841 RepID=UPI00133156B8|nr:hypothetical protein [Streptomyces sp. 2323.1]
MIVSLAYKMVRKLLSVPSVLLPAKPSRTPSCSCCGTRTPPAACHNLRKIFRHAGTVGLAALAS